jgi:NAD(P)-dependent dehydrogenase (short-subunit alcohol dehydrogenase family)
MGGLYVNLANFGLHGKRAVITGASKGIGRGLAIGLAAHGADVVLVARSRQGLEETAAACREARADTRVEVFECDIRNTDQIRTVAESIGAEEPIDILVNNAGLNIRTPALDVTDEEWQTIVDTDLRGAFFFAQQIGKFMVERKSGSIINISSVGGHVALRTGVVYAAAKAGVIQMTKVLALEWGKHNVRVNCIAPWYFRTPLTEQLLNDPKYLSDILSRTPLGRVGDVSELVGPTVFLASDASSYVTGHTLFVDGGMSIYGF